MSETALRHIEHLTNTIGPRGSTTPAERAAHDYCQAELESLGYAVTRESYVSPVSGWTPYSLAGGLVLVAALIFVLMGRGPDAQAGALAAAALALITVVSFFLHITHRPGPLLWLTPTAPSQNVWALAAPSGEATRRVVVTGHVDTHRAALAMRSPQMWRVFRVLTPLVSASYVALLAVFVWGIFTPDALPRTIALYLAALPVIGLALTLPPDYSPYVRGANDNASGAAAVLALAERLKAEPLAQTAVYLVNTGCEEVGCFGLIDFVRRHAPGEAAQASYLVVDNIAGRGSDLNYVLDETLLLPVKADAGLVALAERVAQANPELGAKPWHYRGLTSELAVATVHGVKALGLLNFDPTTGMPPNFHTHRDDMSNIDPAVLDRSEQFLWALLQELDSV
jgi:hypothetical protein